VTILRSSIIAGSSRGPLRCNLGLVPAPTTAAWPRNTKHRPKKESSAAASFSARARPAASAASISVAVSAPTSHVTSRDPRSLSGSMSHAGTRATAGWCGRSTALATIVAAASAAAASDASTVTASAMPKEKLRPPLPLHARPEVARPRTGMSAVEPQGAKDCGAARSATSRSSATRRCQVKRDVAAVVDVGALERRGGGDRREDVIGDRAGDRGHRR